jgi:bifunctional N-acetylglucosamine-1-phosphate-uridyltransferase/glucosamine-1-phosphate-acetyltransferase GlmU-like protein
MLVAPVRLGAGSQTGAGSVVTSNVKAGEMVFGVPAISRGKAKKRVAKKKPARKRAAKRPTGRKGKKG